MCMSEPYVYEDPLLSEDPLDKLILDIYVPPRRDQKNEKLWNELRFITQMVMATHKPGDTPDPFGDIVSLVKVPEELLKFHDFSPLSYNNFPLVPVADPLAPVLDVRYHTYLFFQLRMCPYGRTYDMRWICWVVVGDVGYEICNSIFEEKTKPELLLRFESKEWLLGELTKASAECSQVAAGLAKAFAENSP